MAQLSHSLFMTCLLPVQNLFITFSLSVHYLFITCTSVVHDMFWTCSLHVLDLLITYWTNLLQIPLRRLKSDARPKASVPPSSSDAMSSVGIFPKSS